MAFFDRELVDRNLPETIQPVLHATKPLHERALIDLLDRIPAHAKPGGDLFDRQDLREPRNRVGESCRHARIAVEPRHRFDRGPAARTLDARAGHQQPRIPFGDRQIAHAPLGRFMDRHDRAATLRAALHMLGLGRESNDQSRGGLPKHIRLGLCLRAHLRDHKAFPSTDCLEQRDGTVADSLRHRILRCLQHATVSPFCHA
jgi:hypothetical protein